MKALFTFITIFIFTAAQAGFEGIITTEVYANGSKITTKWFVKNDQLKLQMNYQAKDGPVKVDMIMKKGSNILTIVTDSKDYKGYSEIDGTAINSNFGIDNLHFTTNGITEEELTKYQSANTKFQSAVWLLELDVDLTPFAKFFKDDPAFVLIGKQGLKGFPQKSMLTNHNGELVYSLTITNTEKKSLADATFSVPEGFEKREPVEMESNK